MSDGRNEVSHYPEIQNFIEEQLKSNFRSRHGEELYIYWGIGELKSNLKRIISQHPIECECMKSFSSNVPPLNLDIFGVVTNGKRFELMILEIKKMKTVGLKEWSQLVGYCLVSGAKYGLLMNIDNGCSDRLTQILALEPHLSKIENMVKGAIVQHYLGFMQWDSLTHCFDYSNLGSVKSITDLSNKIDTDFS